MARVIWTDPARDDLSRVLDYIGRDSQHYARQFGERLIDSLDRLEAFPRCGRVVPEFEHDTHREIRQLTFGAYRILYEVRGHDCFIAAIVHSSRDLLRHVHPEEWDISPRG